MTAPGRSQARMPEPVASEGTPLGPAARPGGQGTEDLPSATQRKPAASLRRRLARVGIVLLVGLCSQWLLADRMIVHVGESEMATRLQHDADSLPMALSFDADGRLRVDMSRVGVIYSSEASGHYFVARAAGHEVASPSFGTTPAHLAVAPDDEGLAREDGPFGQPLLVLTRQIELEGREVELVVAEDLSALRWALLEFRLLFLGASLTVLTAAVVVQRREIRHALAGVERARDAILKVPEGGPLPQALDAPEEIRPLLDEIDRLMRFVERRLHQSRTAVGNLSHALKTPLAGLMRLVDDPRIASHAELRDALREQLEAMRQRIERELRRARIAGESGSGRRFDAREELPVLVELLRRIHADKALQIDWQAPPRTLPVDREDALELLGNLADNACKWAVSRLEITISADGEGVLIRVSDDGPGCPPELLEALGTRGTRADEARPGHGLGLGIARDIVEAAGGSLRFARSATLGGLEVSARFPA